ncbi:MAG: hypothetical protein GIW99_12020 [Candidatus Eremiobacteraeota bacterium]|nr:hypothetical protein [Candidatus Eremiobacteraeota bacterium]MBC5828387.1 hypothetical protein [Candidatus Eremiobacteraeota bacterium]
MGGQFFTPAYIAKTVDFILFVGFIVWLYRSYIQPALVAHQNAQNRAVEEAQSKRVQAAAGVIAAEEALVKAKIDAERIFSVAQEQAENMVVDERTKARERAQRVVAYAAGETQRERYRARHTLLLDTVDRAHQLAREAVRTSMDDDAQRRLVAAFVDDLEARANA